MMGSEQEVNCDGFPLVCYGKSEGEPCPDSSFHTTGDSDSVVPGEFVDPTTVARQLYTCCPEAGCTGFRDSLAFLHSFGIEPGMEIDEEGHHYFEFTIPTGWTIDERRRFNTAIAERVGSERPPCDNCGNVMYSEAWWATCKDCKAKFLLCEECTLIPVALCGCETGRQREEREVPHGE